jgi:thymidylate synthase (FAD)
MTVKLIEYMGTDHSVIQAMLVSTGTYAEDTNLDRDFGRINFLMKNRHGTPFEHNSMMFYIEAPIFVFREFHRHRIGWSYNEASGRYKQLAPMFYVPAQDRPLVQQGKPGAYEFVPGTDDQHMKMAGGLKLSYEEAYASYLFMLENGIAKEVARMCLPVATYSSMYATCNARSLMAFLSLRTKSDDSTFKSYPMREIELVAEQMEAIFSALFPMTYRSFCDNGRVSP